MQFDQKLQLNLQDHLREQQRTERIPTQMLQVAHLMKVVDGEQVGRKHKTNKSKWTILV